MAQAFGKVTTSQQLSEAKANKLAQVKLLQKQRLSYSLEERRTPKWVGLTVLFAATLALSVLGIWLATKIPRTAKDNRPEATPPTSVISEPGSTVRHGIIQRMPESSPVVADYILMDGEDVVAYLREGRKMKDLEGFYGWEVDIKGWVVETDPLVLEVEGIVF